MSPIRTANLLPWQREQLASYRERWSARTAQRKSDRAAAEEGLRLAYHEAGLAPPDEIVWCLGPLDVAGRLAQEHCAPISGASVKWRLVDGLKEAVSIELQAYLSPSLRAEILRGVGLAPPLSIGRVVNDCVAGAMANEYARAYSRRCRFMNRLGWGRLEHWRTTDDFRQGTFSRYSAPWLAFFEFIHDVCDPGSQARRLRGLWQAVRNGGWFLAYERTCWITEPPVVLETDPQNRLHSRTGPALAFPDGWSLYAWKGIQVPERIIREADRLTADDISRQWDPMIRRCMLEIYTPERYVRGGHATRAAEDETGILWRKRWFEGDSWAAVEVVNGTPEPDGTYKHYYLQVPPTVRTPREAVAWTYGLSEHEYAAVRRRT